ncbi:hypothetical protein ACJMK2_028766 [Sinanodonta woodiana]|uniref:E3 UFM1-protein ligase 1 n=1 Tax=Sinanodonta woodiana TaxID=1069815 RepID=A0ABD3XAD3_SINWO
MADWEEVRRLAADFQQAQLSSTTQRLSERNLIEIVTKLVELRLVEVIYTLDGKEYLTPQELTKEIKEELFVHGGRINLVELQQELNVDFSHIETKVNEIVKHDRNLTLVLGQLIDKSYLDRIAEEVNDNLKEQGHVTVGELTKLYDLPADFLSENIHSRVGSIIIGQVDSYDKNVIFTGAYVTRMRAKIRGGFRAITRPTQVMSILHQHQMQERIFFSILEELLQKGQLAGSLSGGKHENATYIPDIYSKAQNEYVDCFYRQNGYLEYDSLIRMGISDPKGFIKKRYKSELLLYLSTCCAGHAIQDQMDASIEEALSNEAWVDVMPHLPSVFSPSDAGQLLGNYLKSHPGLILCCDTIVTTDKFIQSSYELFKPLMQAKAEKDSKSHPIFLNPDEDKKAALKSSGETDKQEKQELYGKDERKEQRRKKATSGNTKSGGGTQGREVKTKSLKKKGKSSDFDNASAEDKAKPSSKGQQLELVFMTQEEIEKTLKQDKQYKNCPEEFISEIAHKIIRPLTRQYQEIAKSIFLQNTGVDSSFARRKTQGDLEEKLSGLWTNAILFEKGMKLFSEEVQLQLGRHLLRTVCTDIVNLVLNSVATEHMLSVAEEAQISPEGRAKLIQKLPKDVQNILNNLNTSLGAKNLDEFFDYLNAICGPSHLGILLKKPDKRKERQLIFSHRQSLLQQMNQESDPAMTLHLASVILFQTFTQSVVHAPGKCVPHIISFLKTYLDSEKFTILTNLQELVVKYARSQGSDGNNKSEEMETLTREMSSLVPRVKELVHTTKKTNQPTEMEEN